MAFKHRTAKVDFIKFPLIMIIIFNLLAITLLLINVDAQHQTSESITDVDECKNHSDLCDPKTAFCGYINGSYVCDCKTGFEHYSTDSNSCQDVNECLSGNKCDEMSSICVNAPGSYVCRCIEGFEPFTHFECKDVDECERGSFNCDSETTTCENVPGTYLCQCKPGFSKQNRTSCRDLNDCDALDNICDPVSTSCEKVFGGVACRCKQGFFNKSGTFHSCQDVNECELDENICDKTATRCINTVGSFMCRCKAGYQEVFNGTLCSDINECKSSITFCHALTSTCHNTPGSYLCSCNIGYVAVNNDSLECRDVNECEGGGVMCDEEHSDCINTQGSFYCACKNGVEPTEFHCIRRIEEVEEDGLEYKVVGSIVLLAVLIQSSGIAVYWFVIRKKASKREKNLIKASEKEELKMLMKEKETKEEIKKRRKRERMKGLKYSFEGAEDFLDADKKKLRREVKKINRNLNKNFNKVTKKVLGSSDNRNERTPKSQLEMINKANYTQTSHEANTPLIKVKTKQNNEPILNKNHIISNLLVNNNYNYFNTNNSNINSNPDEDVVGIKRPLNYQSMIEDQSPLKGGCNITIPVPKPRTFKNTQHRNPSFFPEQSKFRKEAVPRKNTHMYYNYNSSTFFCS